MASHSLNDSSPWPESYLNKIQKAKVKKLIQENIENPHIALQLVKDYVCNQKKLTIRGVCFDNESRPEGLEVITANTSYLFEFEKLRKRDGV